MKKFALTERFKESVEIGGTVYYLDLSFDNVLRVFELFSDEEFHPTDRMVIALEMLLGKEDIDINFEEISYSVIFILKHFLDIDITETENPNADAAKYFDLYEDSERIYALFMKVYNIDLFDMQGKLHFKKFSTLLGQALDRDLDDIVGIRAGKVPKATKYNKEERERMLKLKRLYKLDSIEDPDLIVERVDNAFDKVANFFRPKGGEK